MADKNGNLVITKPDNNLNHHGFGGIVSSGDLLLIIVVCPQYPTCILFPSIVLKLGVILIFVRRGKPPDFLNAIFKMEKT